jgi:hypothetical protein
MKLEEAKAIAVVLSQADGGCSHCVSALTKYMQKVFPEFAWAELVRAGGEAVDAKYEANDDDPDDSVVSVAVAALGKGAEQ